MASSSSPVNTTRSYIPIIGLSAIQKLGYAITLCPNTTVLEQWRLQEVANIAASTPIWPTGKLIKVLTESDAIFRKWNGVSAFTTVNFGSSSVDHFKGSFASLEALQIAFPTASIGDYAAVDAGISTDIQIYFYDENSGWLTINPVNRFKGIYATIGDLTTAHPTATSGDYAQVDEGAGHNLILYLYDIDEGWVPSSVAGPGTTDDLTEGSTNLYFTTNRVLAYFQGFSRKNVLDLADKLPFLDSAASFIGKYLTFDDLLTNLTSLFTLKPSTEKTSLDSGDRVPLEDSAFGLAVKYITFTDFITNLQSYFIKKPTTTPVTDGHLAVFDGTTGLLLKDGGAVPSGGNGTIGGSSGSTDNALIRADGTGGSTIQTSLVIVDDNGEIYAYKAKINTQTGTTYTLQSSDCGKIITLDNGSGITVTLPNNLPVGFNCTLCQLGVGQVSLSASVGALKNRLNATKIAGQYGQATLWVYSNTDGTSALYQFQGDTTV